MEWRFWDRKRETRSQDYTDDILVKNLLAAASGDIAAGLTSAVEVCAGHWQRAFASAALEPDTAVADALYPFLGQIGRQLLTAGESIFYLETAGGRFQLLPICDCTVKGEPAPESWAYEVTLSGPSTTLTRTVGPDRILHLTYTTSAREPWRGIGPIEASATTRKLLDNLELRLGQEAGEAVGTLIPVPNVKTTGQLQADIRGLKGQATLVESTSQGWGTGSTGAPNADYLLRRIGANPPQQLVQLRRETEESILAAAGLPISIIAGGDGTLAREGFRQFLHATIMPVAEGVARQIQERFELPAFGFNFDKLMASDLQGRARSFQSMVGGGMPVEEAARLAGLMVME